MDNKKKINGRKIFDVVSWVLIFFLFSCSLGALLVKNKKGTVYIFGSRYDVVLTDSMSTINENHSEFLSGKSNQIQAFDLVRSEKVNAQTKLNLYDVVLFNNPYVGTDMHRVVGIEEDSGDEIYLEKNTFATVDGKEGLLLPNIESRIYTNTLNLSGMELDILTSDATYNNGYYFNFGGTNIEPTVTTTQVGDKYLHHLVLSRNTSRPVIVNLTHRLEFDYNDHLLLNVTYHSYYGDIHLNNSEFVLNEHEEYFLRTNITYKYEIRGDKAKDSDGTFKIDQIYSKVVQVIPKAGYVVRYMTSTFGILMFVGIGLIIIGAQFALDHMEKKEKKALEMKKEESTNEKE